MQEICSVPGGVPQRVYGKVRAQCQRSEEKSRDFFNACRMDYHSKETLAIMNMSMGKLGEIVKGREAWHAAVHGVTKSWTGVSD